ncbi:hypothetical protein [Bacillus cereus]|uniref:hypothetical protein n=1 Tax=Bacillus cereus TaxID=1396 RepID=UPI0020BF110A|nr:hypothetical protein [Bacillus cereus]
MPTTGLLGPMEFEETGMQFDSSYHKVQEYALRGNTPEQGYLEILVFIYVNLESYNSGKRQISTKKISFSLDISKGINDIIELCYTKLRTLKEYEKFVVVS